MYTYIAFGVGTIPGAALLGIIQDKYGHKASITLIIALVITFFTFLIVVNE